MARISTSRAAYQRINPNLRIGKPPVRVQTTSTPTVRVYGRNTARPVSSFPLTMEACKNLAQASDLSPVEIFNKLANGGRLFSRYNGYPAILKTAR